MRTWLTILRQRSCPAALLVILLAAATTARAGLVDDWIACKRDVLPQLRGQQPTQAAAQYCMGLGYMTGQLNGTRDSNAAAQWFARAARQGYASAEVVLGYNYEKAYGVTANPALAVAWYRKAAAQGNADGLFNLGRAYQYGVGVAANPAQAQTYYRQAIARGSTDARSALDSMQGAFAQARKLYDAKDYVHGTRQMLVAANAGNTQAQLLVGNAYQIGMGVAADPHQAALWYEKAARQGNAQAQKDLGNLYETGNGVPENWALAVQWYRQSAQRHNAEGEFALGRMYQFGMAVPQNRKTAIGWFHMAADQGNAQAAYFAKWLSDPTNNIGFRNEQEHQLVIGTKLRFAGNLIGGDPYGITFRNSAERMAWLNKQRKQADLIEAQTLWGVRKNNYDSCMAAARGNCQLPGPQPGY